jgi:hypothetical protein
MTLRRMCVLGECVSGAPAKRRCLIFVYGYASQRGDAGDLLGRSA